MTRNAIPEDAFERYVAMYFNDQVVASDGLRNGGEMACVVPAGPIRVECNWKGLSEPMRRELTLQVGEQGEAGFTADQ
jgi:hypothetical protein